MVRKRNPQDTTIRNVQAANKRISKLEDEVKELKKVAKEFKRLEKKLRDALIWR